MIHLTQLPVHPTDNKPSTSCCVYSRKQVRPILDNIHRTPVSMVMAETTECQQSSYSAVSRGLLMEACWPVKVHPLSRECVTSQRGAPTVQLYVPAHRPWHSLSEAVCALPRLNKWRRKKTWVGPFAGVTVLLKPGKGGGKYIRANVVQTSGW